MDVRPAQRQLWVDGRLANIGARAFDVLLALIERSDRVVTKAELMEAVWPGVAVEDNNIVVQVGALRKALGQGFIETVHGKGYRFTPPVDDELERVSAARLLPPEPSLSMVGRESDIEQLAALMRSHRLVTVCGAGGWGKTRLALHHAHQRGPATVRWVQLDRMPAHTSAEQAMAEALRLTLRPGEHLAAAVGRCERPLPELLVLDNADLVVDEVARLVQLLLECLRPMRILVTSQMQLCVPQEHLLRLSPLAVPEGIPPLPRALSHSAVALFVNRARAADPRFTLEGGNVPHVVEICRRLDGHPLALELAADRAALLGLRALRDGLEDGLSLLRTGQRDAPPRQQTLEAAFEWTHALLEPIDQVVFRRLGILPGRFSLDMAQQIVAEPERRIDTWGVVNAMASLVDRSLVAAEAIGTLRYRLLNTTRTFALSKLREAGELPEWQQRLKGLLEGK